MAPTSTSEELDYLFHHVFLPPQLPHAAEDPDEKHKLEMVLAKAALESLRRYRNRCPQREKVAARRAFQGVEDALVIHNTTTKDINEDDLAAWLAATSKEAADVPLPLHIKSQNCGVILRWEKDGLMFEAFELSATNEKVTGTTGRLLRQFPSASVLIAKEHASQKDFQTTVARTLAAMACGTAPGMQPQIQKAGKNRDELRDTANPAIVTGLFFGAFLESTGSTKDVCTITKNTRDEVLWRDTLCPWRRSPMWLLIRVHLQLAFHRAGEPEGFKRFMATFMGDILSAAHSRARPSRILYAMSAKISRRLIKFGNPLPAQLLNPLRDVIEASSQTLQERWSAAQGLEQCFDVSGLQYLKLDEDRGIELPALELHLDSIAQRHSKDRNTSFVPSGGLLQIKPRRWPHLPESFSNYEVANLTIFENWVATELRACMNAYDEDVACPKAYELMKRYHQLASTLYADNPEALSSMILTLIEIWVCCDVRAISVCPSVAEYDHGIPGDVFQNLLLPSRLQMKRLLGVEQHLAGRSKSGKVLSNHLLCGETTDRKCFAARYFDDHRYYQDLMDRINTSSEAHKTRKLSELEDLKGKHAELRQRSENKSHGERIVLQWDRYGNEIGSTKVHDDTNCQKCLLLKESNEICIDVYEWPLPRDSASSDVKAKVVVFELDPPTWFDAWRDCTAYLISDVLVSQYVDRKKPKSFWELKDNYQLGRHYKPHSKYSSDSSSMDSASDDTFQYDSMSEYHEDEDEGTDRIVMASLNKPFKASHYKQVQVTEATTEKDVIVPSGARYQYFDSVVQCLVGPQKATANMASACSYRMPDRSKALERYLLRTVASPDGEAPNTAIANLFTCPVHMTANEFLELCSVPEGHLLQWRHVVAQLHAPGVDLRKEETVLVFLLCLYQTGPAVVQHIDSDYDSLRASHSVTGHSDLQNDLLAGLNESLDQIKQNWESANAVLILAAIAGRLLSLCSSDQVQTKCRNFLERCRGVASEWLFVLRGKMQAASVGSDRAEFLAKTTEVTCICMLTFDLDAQHFSRVLKNQDQASLFLQCSITLSELGGGASPTPGSTVALLKLRFQRVLYRGRDILLGNIAALDDAIAKSWAAYRPGTNRWRFVSDSWITKQAAVSGGDHMDLHFDLLSGELRVNGERLKRTPKAYEAHPLYITLFGKVGVEVLESRVPGMRFSTKKQHEGFSIQLNLKGGSEFIVQARTDHNTYETLPERLFKGIFPETFVDEYVYWYDEANDSVEFRPKHSPWPTGSSRSWTLSRMEGEDRWCLSKDGTCLISAGTVTAKQMAILLSPLISPMRIHLLLDKAHNRLDVDLPSLRLGFSFLQGTPHLLSKEFRLMAVEPDQRLGTLVGFRNKLLLRHVESGSRLALIPEGPLSHEMYRDHVSVTVDRAAVSKVHPIQVDSLLGRLVDNGSTQCKLFMAYLHALTSFCLPDPLTRKSGTEQALTILNSAAVRSFDQLTEGNKALLLQIARLSPGRDYYPKEDRLMQTVTWDSELSFLSQHGWFYKAVKKIFAQAKRSSHFHPEVTLRLPVIDHVAESLLDRDTVRTSAFHISDFGAEDHTARHDVEYTTGARDQHSVPSGNAFQLCFAVTNGSDGIIWKAPSLKQLWDPLEKVSVVPGSHDDQDMMKYDSSLLALSEISAIQHLLPVASAVGQAHADGKQFNKYGLMVWLATMAFSSNANLDVLQTTALVAATPELRGIPVPDVEYCSPADGRTCKNIPARDALTELIMEAVKPYSESPEYQNPLQMKPKETWHDAQRRTIRKFELMQKDAVKHFVAGIRRQWPVKEPKAPESPCPDWVVRYIDVKKALEVVKPKFQTWYNNELLFQYLHQLQEKMAGLERITIDLPDRTMSYSTPSTQLRRICISVSNLFAGTAPALPPEHARVPQLNIVEMPEMPRAAPNANESRLETLIEDMKSASSGFETEYLEHLQGSLLSLRKRPRPTFAGIPSLAQVQVHLRLCEDHAAILYRAIQTAMRDSQGALVGHTQPWHSPRVSPMLLIQQLSRDRWRQLSGEWKSLIVQYGLALAACQRATRLLHASITSNAKELIKELRNSGHVNWSPLQYPESLLLEIESGILIRDVQEEIAAEMRAPRGGCNSVVQLNMGEGKSSVIVPMVASALANGSQLVRVVVAKPQSKQMAQMLQSKLGGLLNRRIYYMPFSRAVEPTQAMAEALYKTCGECMAGGGVMLVQPEHLLSFKLMSLECYTSMGNPEQTQIAQKSQAANHIMRIQDFLEMNTRDVVDESDEIFSVKFELVYTMGMPRDIELAPSRWQHIQKILALLRAFGKEMVSKRPSALEYNDHGHGGFPRIRLLEQDAGDLLIKRIAREVCDHGSLEFRVDESVREDAFIYMTKYDLTKEEIDVVQKSKFWTANKTTLLLFRGLFATGILAFTLGQKRWRVNYGLTDRLPKTLLAVPFYAKDSPSARSEFSHPDVVIILTSLSYYYGGLSDNDLFLAFGHLLKSDNAIANYNSWVAHVDIPPEFRQLRGINLNDRPTCISLIFPPLRHAKGVVDYFLSNVVFRKEMREFPKKLSTSGWDIAKRRLHPTTGFSGTNDSRVCLPGSMVDRNLPSQRHTDALVLDYLLQPQNSVAAMPESVGPQFSDAERLLEMVIDMSPPVQVILDVGAQILELNNESVAVTWLRKCQGHHMEAAVFCNMADELMVVDRKGNRELLQTSPYSSRLDVCLVYLDEAHTRGIDLKLPQNSRAAVTLGANLTKDRLVQACMRMRELGKGQTVVFCVSAEINAKIRACNTQQPGHEILEVEDVIRWTIWGTFDETRRSMPLWAIQGHRFLVQQRLWNSVTSEGKTRMTPDWAVHFLENEGKTIASRYSPGDRFARGLDKMSNSQDPEFIKLAKRCREYDHLETSSRRFQEEQERELLAESEEERIVESAMPAEPAQHQLSKALVRLVQVGKLVDKHGNTQLPHSTFEPAFGLLKTTTASSELDVGQLVPIAAVMATRDFGRTVQNLDTESAHDSFQRPVRHILTIRPHGGDVATMVILISPFEAQALIGYVQISPYAAIHFYKPRNNLGYQPLDELASLTVSNVRVKISIPMALKVQLNVFAGALYFNDFQEYEETCKFLGLASTPAKKGWVVDSDGFIQRDGQGRKGGESGVQKSPIEFLKVLLMKIRRTGEDINATHVGKLLEGKLLKREDFAKRG